MINFIFYFKISFCVRFAFYYYLIYLSLLSLLLFCL